LTTTEKYNIKKVIILTGPTCSNKTENSIKIATKYNAEIISADSLQIYKNFDIGTSKPNKVQRKKIIHHLIDIVNPKDEYDAWKYMDESRKIVRSSKNKLFILSGGTQLYIDVFLNGLSEGISKNIDLRDELEERIKKFGLASLHEEIIKVDPSSSEKLSKNDKSRIIRYLEIFYSTKTKPSEHFEKNIRKKFDGIKYIKTSLDFDKKVLDKRIEDRVQAMVKKGLLNEVQSLLNKYGSNVKPIKSIGYKEIVDFLNNKTSYDESINKIVINTRRLAKRQLTWLRKDKELNWFKSYKDLEKFIEKFITN